MTPKKHFEAFDHQKSLFKYIIHFKGIFVWKESNKEYEINSHKSKTRRLKDIKPCEVSRIEE